MRTTREEELVIPKQEAKYIARITLGVLKEYINKTLCSPPWEGFLGDISSRIDERLNYFYWLFSDKSDELKKYYRPEPQYLPGISKFLKEYVIKYGEYLDSQESWKPEYLDLVSTDKKFCIEDYENGFKTFNEFFTRKVKPDKRPIQEGFVAPVDGLMQNVYGVIDGNVDVKIKTTVYHNVEKLLEESFNKGILIQIFLDIFDYHRIHAPIDMEIVSIKKIEGGNYLGGFVEYLNGSYVLDSSEYGWQSIETRVVIKAYNNNLGNFYMVAVGMSHVGSIEISCHEGGKIKKGNEIGLFKFGGSCVLLLLEKQVKGISKKHYLMGEKIFD